MTDLRSRAPDVQLADCALEDEGAQDSLPFTFPKTPENEGDMGLYHHHPHHHAQAPIPVPGPGTVGPGVGMQQVPMPIPPGMEFLAVHLQHIHGSISALQQQFCCLLSEQSTQRMQIQELQAQQERQHQSQQQALAQQRLRERRRIQLRLLQGPNLPLEAALSDCDLALPADFAGEPTAPHARTRSAPPILRSAAGGEEEQHREVLSPSFAPSPAARAAAKGKKKTTQSADTATATADAEGGGAAAVATAAGKHDAEEGEETQSQSQSQNQSRATGSRGQSGSGEEARASDCDDSMSRFAASTLQKFEVRLSDVAESVGGYSRRLEVAEHQLEALSVTCQQFQNALASEVTTTLATPSSRSSSSVVPKALERTDSKSAKAKTKGQGSTASTAQAKAAAKAAAAAAKATASSLGGGSNKNHGQGQGQGHGGSNGTGTGIGIGSQGASCSVGSKNFAGSSGKDAKLSSDKELRASLAGVWEFLSNNPAFGAILALLVAFIMIWELRTAQLSASQYIDTLVDHSRSASWVAAASAQQVFSNLGLAPTSVVGTSKSTETVVATDRSAPLGVSYAATSTSGSGSGSGVFGGLSMLSVTATRPVTLPQDCDGLEAALCTVSRTTAISSPMTNNNGSVPPSVAVKARDSSSSTQGAQGDKPLPTFVVDFSKKVGLSNPFQLDHLRRSSLHLAAAEGRSDVVRALLACSDFSEVNGKDLQGNTALHLAAHQAFSKVVAELLKSPRFTKASEPNLADKTALHMAVGSPLLQTHGAEAALQLLKALPPSVVNQQDHSGRTILHLAVHSGQPELLEAILSSSKFTVAKLKDNRGMTALHVAAAKGLVSLVRSLLKVRYNHDAAMVLGLANVKDHDGQTAMDVADGENKFEVMNSIVNSVTEARLKIQATVPTKRILGDLAPLTVPSSPTP